MNDIDKIVKTKSIPEIKNHIRLADFMLDCATPETLDFWLEEKGDWEFALGVAEWWGEQPIATIPSFSPSDKFMQYLLKRINRLELALKEIKRQAT